MRTADLDRVEQTYRRVGTRWAWNVVSLAGFQGWEPSLRRQTVAGLGLRPGDAVLDVACGRGSNFAYLQDAVGPDGRIVGVDYSPTMLSGAEELVQKKGWSNVELVRADGATIDYDAEFDGALCTIALAVIPEWRETLRRMVGVVRPGRRVAVMDGRRDSMLARLGAPFAWLFARVVAADLDRDIEGECRSLLDDVREQSRMFGVYFVLSGARRPDA